MLKTHSGIDKSVISCYNIIMKKLLILLISLLIVSCMQYSHTTQKNEQERSTSRESMESPQKMNPCDYKSINGKIIVIGQKTEENRFWGFPTIKVNPDPDSDYLMDYNKYEGMKGKLLTQISSKDGNQKYDKIVLSNCELVYVNEKYSGYEYYTRNLYDEVHKMIGDSVWIKHRTNINQIQEKYGLNATFGSIEHVEITGVHPNSYVVGSRMEAQKLISSVMLIVENSSIKRAFVPYSPKYYSSKSPLSESWPLEIRYAIKNGEIVIGMTKDQVKLSWGNPIDINKTVTEESTSQQWVYKDDDGRTYLYFENGKLTAYQN